MPALEMPDAYAERAADGRRLIVELWNMASKPGLFDAERVELRASAERLYSLFGGNRHLSDGAPRIVGRFGKLGIEL